MSHALSFRLLVLCLVAATLVCARQGPDSLPPPPALSIAPATGHDHVALGRPMDLNRATAKDLRAVPGVGPSLARRIVAGRPYGSCEDLLGVKGIGARRLEALRPFVTVARPDASSP